MGVKEQRHEATRRMILRRGLLAPLAALLLVCAILVAFFALYSRDRVKAELVHLASSHRRLVDQFLAERRADLGFAASSANLEELLQPGALEALLRQIQSGSEAFFDLGVFDAEGRHVAYVGPYNLAGRSYAGEPWFQTVRERGFYVSDVFLGIRKSPHFVIAVKREEGDRVWYLRATIDTLFFNDLVESIRVGRTGEAYLVNREGVFQTRRQSGGSLLEADPDFAVYPRDGEGVHSFSARSEGRRYLYATGPLREVDWVLVIRQEARDAYAPVTRALLVALGVILAGGCIVIPMSFLLASGLAARLTAADAEKQQMRTQLILAGKMAEIGEMATGIAHEINNPLQVIKSEQALIRDLVQDLEAGAGPEGSKNLAMLKDSTGQIEIQVDRCKQITQGLLRFSRKEPAPSGTVRLQDFLPEVFRMVAQRARDGSVRLVEEMGPGLPPIPGDPSQLQQVFLNLLNNALYALKGRESGEIRVSTSLEPGCLAVSVTDNGCGITPDDLQKIFLPFFTTKPVGHGTGLGLSTVYGIVQGLGGEISVTSEVGAGSVFTIRLPLDRNHEQERGDR